MYKNFKAYAVSRMFILASNDQKEVMVQWLQRHNVIRLPPIQCPFNTIQLVWSDMKNYVRNNKSFTIIEVERLLRVAVANVDAASWKKKVEHVEKLIRAAQTMEGIISNNEQLTICLGDDDFGSEDGELYVIAPLSQ